MYVDDMITKFKNMIEHVRHLHETFKLLKKYKVKLNPRKCVLRVSLGKFLGFSVSHRGIKVIVEIKSPRTLQEI